MAVTMSQSAAVAPAPTLTSSLKDTKSSQAASDIETSLSSLAAQLGGAVGASENLQTDFLSAFVQLLQSQAVCLSVTAFFIRIALSINLFATVSAD